MWILVEVGLYSYSRCSCLFPPITQEVVAAEGAELCGEPGGCCSTFWASSLRLYLSVSWTVGARQSGGRNFPG